MIAGAWWSSLMLQMIDKPIVCWEVKKIYSEIRESVNRRVTYADPHLSKPLIRTSTFYVKTSHTQILKKQAIILGTNVLNDPRDLFL